MMPNGSANSGLLWPTLFTVSALAVLLSLGTWQWQRMLWKQEIIANLVQAGDRLPKDYGALDVKALPGGEAGRYTPIQATGRFRHDEEVYVFWTRGSQAGYLVLTPFQPDNGKPLLVNRGFVPERLITPETRREGQLTGSLTVRGLLVGARGSESIFTPDPDVAKRIWFEIAPGDIAEKLGIDVLRTHTLAADDAPNPGGWPKGQSVRERITAIPNRHLEYAMTWWGLALTLIGVYVAYAWSRMRELRRSEE